MLSATSTRQTGRYEMQSEIRRWIAESRKKLEGKGLDDGDLNQLEALLDDGSRPLDDEPRPLDDGPRPLDDGLRPLDDGLRPKIMYLTARSTNMRSGIVGWVEFVPGEKPKLKLPGDEPPYESVLEAVADGWRVVQYPIPKLYEYKDLENDYVGFDFILEKWN